MLVFKCNQMIYF